VDDHYTPAVEGEGTFECAQEVFKVIADQARGVYGLNGNQSWQLRAQLLTGRADLAKPYQTFLATLPITADTMATLSRGNPGFGLDSCYLTPRYLIVHCHDDAAGGRILLRDQGGYPLRDWAGNLVYLELKGALSQSGGTTYGAAFLENGASPMFLTREREHHEQVHTQQWAQHGYNFANKYISEAAGDQFEAWWYAVTSNRWLVSACFNVFERNAGLADAGYVCPWE
jgi:hypothetical protein